MTSVTLGRRIIQEGRMTLALCALAMLLAGTARAAVDEVIPLPGHIPALVAASTLIGPVNPNLAIPLEFLLLFRDKGELDSFVSHVSTPNDPLYGHYLSSANFQSLYSPSQSDYSTLKAYAASAGFTVTHTISSRKLLSVVAPASVVEAAFHIQLLEYQAPDGHQYYAPNANPSVPASVAPLIEGIIGLDTAAVWLSHARKALPQGGKGQLHSRLITASSSPATAGSGTGGAMTPKDIETAYNLKIYPPASTGDTSGYGKGQVLGLFELDTYAPSDILLYEQKFGLPQLVPTNETDPTNPVTPTGGEDEVELDIELQLAIAPLASQILVYSGGNTSALVVQQYQKIADDNLAREISTSWGSPEVGQDHVTLDGESDAFEQMAAQGQSIFAAAGDNGAYDGAGTSATVNMTDPTALLVDDPASQPYMTGVGGTTLSVVAPGTNETYLSEKTWGIPSDGSAGSSAQGGGGGISQKWPMPFYQQGHVPSPGAIPSSYYPITTAHPDPATHRNVPDVSFNADPNTGYDIVIGGTDTLLIGGTSAAAPIWAGFTARTNEQRTADGLPPVGFVNPALYYLGGQHIHNDYHDVADGSTNLYFPAVKGYDNATGFGAFIGNVLGIDLGSPYSPYIYDFPGDKIGYINWTAQPQALHYLVYRASSLYGAYGLIATTNGPGYTDYNLTNGTSYFYRVKTQYSGGYSLPTYSVQVVPAVVAIASGPYVQTGSGQATITWTTNVLARSTVNYGTSSASLTQTQYSNPNRLSITHSITLTGLVSGTTYYYQVSSNDNYVTASSAVLVFSVP